MAFLQSDGSGRKSHQVLDTAFSASLLELRIRHALEREKATISTGSRKKVKLPTAPLLRNMWSRKMLSSILVVYLKYDDRIERHSPRDIDPEVFRLLELAGYDSKIQKSLQKTL